MIQETPAFSYPRLRENGDELCVTVSARRDGLWLAFLSVCLLVFVYTIAGILSAAWTKSTLKDLLAVVPIGLWGLFLWLWLLFGKSEITASEAGLSVRRSLFGIGSTRNFAAHTVQHLCVSSAYAPISTKEMLFRLFSRKRSIKGIWEPGPFHGPLAFDGRAGTVRFGAGLSEDEARELLPHIVRRLSSDDPT